MLELLYFPDFIAGLTLGAIVGATVATGLIHFGFVARERRIRLETARIQARAQAARAARAWRTAGAANDDSHQRSPRAEMRGGPR